MTIFAFLNTLNLAKLIEGILATAGGFLVGYIFVVIFGWMFDKFLLKRKSPQLLHKVCRLLGGLILAIIVALLVFGGGGGEGNGTGDGKGNGKASPANGTSDPNAATDPKQISLKPPPVEERIRVTILGGSDVVDQKFYRIGDDDTARSFAEAKAAITKTKNESTRSLGIEINFTSNNALPLDHPAVEQLKRWARETAGLTVTFPAEAP